MSSTRREVLLAGLGLLVGACRVPDNIPTIPTYTPEPPPAALPTPKPTSTTVETVESRLGKVWEIKILPSRLGNVDPHDPQPPAFFWNSKNLFVNGSDGFPREIKIGNGEDDWWQWSQKGYLLGADLENVFLADTSGRRVYTFGAESKFETWHYEAPRLLLNTASSFNIFKSDDIKWPPTVSSQYISFQFEGGFYLYARNGKKEAPSPGHLVRLVDDKVLYTKENHIFGSTDWRLFDLSAKKPVWEYPSPSKRPIYGAAGGDIFAVSIPQAIAPGKPWMDGPFNVEVRSMRDGHKVWEKSTGFSTGFVSITRDFVVAGDKAATQPEFWVFKKDNGDLVKKFVGYKREHPHEIFEKDGWFFASSPNLGTTAFLNGEEKWGDPKGLHIKGATDCLGVVDGKLLLLKRGESKMSPGRSTENGKLWIIDPADGKEVQPIVELEGPVTSWTIVKNKVVVGSGIKGQRYNLSVVDLNKGTKNDIELQLREPFLHATAIATGRVLGQSGDRLLLVRVA